MFGKGRNEVIDFTALQKRGLIKKEEPKKSELQISKDGYINLSQKKEQEIVSSEIAPQNNNQFDMLNSLASAGNADSEENSQSGLMKQQSAQISPEDIQGLTVKLDDLEYKINNLIDRIIALESKMK